MWITLLTALGTAYGVSGLASLVRYGLKPVWFEDKATEDQYIKVAQWIERQINEKGYVILVKNNGGTHAYQEFHTYTKEEVKTLDKKEWKKCKKQWRELDKCSRFLTERCSLK